VRVELPSGAEAEASLAPDGAVRVGVSCGAVLDDVVLRSYCVGAAHMALSWVRSEGLAVDEDGEPRDLTIRSFGILAARDTPPVDVEIAASEGPPVNGSDAVFAAVAAAAWLADGLPQDWPTRGL
jgi:CO/xanthine dehydrogenase Mo-binding subunit